MKQSIIVLIMAVSALLLLSCGVFETEPNKEIKFNFVFEQGADHSHIISVEKNATENMKLQKTLRDYNKAYIMVIDLSHFKTNEDFLASEEYSAYKTERDLLAEGNALEYWKGYLELIGKHFGIITNQALEIGVDHATGYVPGVIGFNYFFVGLLKDDFILYTGESFTDAEPGKPQTVKIPVQYYNDLPQ